MEYLKLDKKIKKTNTVNNNYYSYRFSKFKSNQVTRDNYLKEKPIKVKKKKKSKKRKIREYLNRIPKKYNIYIKSIHWIKRRSTYWQNYKKQCCICGSFKYVVLHHGFYDNKTFGSEKDEWLFPLCAFHHNDFHEIHKTKKDMLSETLQFIEDNYTPHDEFNC